MEPKKAHPVVEETPLGQPSLGVSCGATEQGHSKPTGVREQMGAPKELKLVWAGGGGGFGGGGGTGKTELSHDVVEQQYILYIFIYIYM